MPNIHIISNHPEHGKLGEDAIALETRAWEIISDLKIEGAVISHDHSICKSDDGKEQIYFSVSSSPKNTTDILPREMIALAERLKEFADVEFFPLAGFYEKTV